MAKSRHRTHAQWHLGRAPDTRGAWPDSAALDIGARVTLLGNIVPRLVSHLPHAEILQGRANKGTPGLEPGPC